MTQNSSTVETELRRFWMWASTCLLALFIFFIALRGDPLPSNQEGADVPPWHPCPIGLLPPPPTYNWDAWDDLSLIALTERVRYPMDSLFDSLQARFGGSCKMSKRSKSLPSLAKKFQSRTQNETRSSLDIIKDIGGIRLVFSDLCELQRCQQSLERHYAIWQKKDFISQPKADGYRSLHYIVIQDDVPIEVQLRTEAMDRWATWTHDLIYKNAELLQGLIGEEALDELRLYAAELAAYQNALEHGIARHPPKRPESLPILWEYASAANREIMREQGDLAPCIIRPCCARDAHTYIGHVAQQGTQHRG